MSFRHGGYRRRHKDDYDERRREVVETPEDRLRTAIIKFGEVDALEELPRLEKQIREHEPRNIADISEAFRISVTEQPYKIPFYIALLRSLYNTPEPVQSDSPVLGRLILEDFWKGFQGYLDKVAWRETRLCIQFFAHLTVAGLISPESMISLLQSFVAVLDEFGVSHGRAKKAALSAGEGLIIAGAVLKAHSPSSVNDMITAIHTYVESTTNAKWLVALNSRLSNNVSIPDSAHEILDSLLTTLNALNEGDFSGTADCIPQPYLQTGDTVLEVSKYDLPSVLVPPEIIEVEGLTSETGSEAQIKKEEWPEYYFRIFPSDVSPDPNTPAGYIIRSALIDTIDIFEINRKECARLLLEYPKWNLPGTFKPKPGSTVEHEPCPGKDWQLDSTVLETILGAYLVLPESSQKSIYYISLITELCKLSPSTVGPAVGKSIRKLYAALSESLDVEVARRFAEWFAVHMSNFGFQWVWKEWVPDLSLAVQHPKRAFIRRVVEFEVRLAYHERILRMLPPQMQDREACVIPEQAPAPAFEYEDPSHPHHEAAQSVLNLFRGRANAEDVIAHLDTLKSQLEASDEGHTANLDSLVRSIAVQSLLNIGSRSFSHLLNGIERYLAVLRNLASGGVSSSGGHGNIEAKNDILAAVASFWKDNRQMVAIVFDKLMQYQIVDPTDVVGWTFLNGSVVGQLREVEKPLNLSAFEWDLLKAALDKANGRVVIARRKVATLRKEDDDARAKAKASQGMEVDGETKPDENEIENPALETALKASESLIREQKAALSRTLEGFVSCLAPSAGDSNPNPHSRNVIGEEAWQNRDNWGRDEWNAWETWGWYRQFVRAYAPYLRKYTNTLETVSFSRFVGVDDPAADLMKKLWHIATGQE
ncbi:Nuclear cap-binding protein subunit 1 [Leucoagaricus sp. SymC.cos]|nr:Nuclear cap-binding protein subunit 1 [Leucoagaricus sp. SymC.cos]